MNNIKEKACQSSYYFPTVDPEKPRIQFSLCFRNVFWMVSKDFPKPFPELSIFTGWSWKTVRHHPGASLPHVFSTKMKKFLLHKALSKQSQKIIKIIPLKWTLLFLIHKNSPVAG